MTRIAGGTHYAAIAKPVGDKDDPVVALDQRDEVARRAHRRHLHSPAADAIARREQFARHRADRDRDMRHPDIGQARRLTLDQRLAGDGDERTQ